MREDARVPENAESERARQEGSHDTLGKAEVEALLSKYATLDPTTGCWLWDGQIDRYGYGRFRGLEDVTERTAHREIYQRVKGTIPPHLKADHECHNRDSTCSGGWTCRHRRCINPDHIEPVTNRENICRAHAARGVTGGHERWKNQRKPGEMRLRGEK